MSKRSRFGLFLLLVIHWSSPGAAPRWVEHASLPGPEVSSSGQSRFDQLFATGPGRYQIPYPFASLVAQLEARVDNGQQTAVRLALIPRGRSLQRNTPAPNFFKFPRAVIALQGEPVTTGKAAGEVLEYRLFIAHQPNTETLEIISYNDLAGRFEFQVVEDYTFDRIPRVRQANRAMCLSCHQNAGPVFPSRPWSETGFNVAIANQLVAARPQQFKSLVGVVTRDAGVIDVLVERANYLAAAQLIWRQGCRSSQCRGALLRAILQYRLSAKSSFDSANPGYRLDYYDELHRNWQSNWPEGLALANSRIPDRDPFAVDAESAELDPLFARPAHATWHELDSILARGIVYRLAGYLTLADIERIDRRLLELSHTRSVEILEYAVSCSLAKRSGQDHVLDCGDENRSSSLQAGFEIQMQQDRPVAMRVIQLRLPRDANLLQPSITRLIPLQHGIATELASGSSALSPRLASGDHLRSLQLHWNGSMLDGEVRLEVQVAQDFQFLEEALSEMVTRNQNGRGDSFSPAPFRREAIMRELGQLLGLPALQWRAQAHSPALQTKPVPDDLDGGLALLLPYCAHCHADPSRNPPGFLAGDQVMARLSQCAPRILARLKAWQVGNEFSGSPMPPPASLPLSGTTRQDWPRSEHYRRLVASVEILAREQHGAQGILGPSGSGYEKLAPCLPSPSE